MASNDSSHPGRGKTPLYQKSESILPGISSLGTYGNGIEQDRCINFSGNDAMMQGFDETSAAAIPVLRHFAFSEVWNLPGEHLLKQ
jgi:hypothetical protein